MKKDFTQIFKRDPISSLSFVIEIDDGSFVLQKHREEALGDEYTLIRAASDKKGEVAITYFVKELYQRGLIVNSIYTLHSEDLVDFSFVDSTHGTIHSAVVLYVRATLVDRQSDLKYVSWEKFNTLLDISALTENTEYTAIQKL